MQNIDIAFCLCLDKRIAEWEPYEQAFKDRLGDRYNRFVVGDGQMDVDYDLVDVPKDKCPVHNWGYGREGYKNHHYNAFLSHQEIFKRVLETDAQNVLMLEDDCYLTSRFDGLWPDVNYVLNDPKFNFVYLGWWCDEKFTKETEEHKHRGIVYPYANNIGGLHGVVISRPTVEFLTRLPPINPIDYQLNQIGHDRFNTYVVGPKLIHTRTCHSYCEGYEIEREKL